MPTIFLIRHGESQSNAGLATSSPEIVELTDDGWEQAKDIAQYLKEDHIHPDLIVTSSYLRTKQTAAATSLVFPNAYLEEWPVQEFTYLSMWHQEKSTTEDRRTCVESYWEIADPTYVDDTKSEILKKGRMPTSESFAQFITRVHKVKEKLEQTEQENIVIFTHAQFITAFRWLLELESINITPEAMRNFRAYLNIHSPKNGAIAQATFLKSCDQWHYKTIVSHMDNNQLATVP